MAIFVIFYWYCATFWAYPGWVEYRGHSIRWLGMVIILRGAWMWWGRIKERIIGVGGANLAVHLKVFVGRSNNIHWCGHLLLVSISWYGIVEGIRVIGWCVSCCNGQRKANEQYSDPNKWVFLIIFDHNIAIACHSELIALLFMQCNPPLDVWARWECPVGVQYQVILWEAANDCKFLRPRGVAQAKKIDGQNKGSTIELETITWVGCNNN